MIVQVHKKFIVIEKHNEVVIVPYSSISHYVICGNTTTLILKDIEDNVSFDSSKDTIDKILTKLNEI